MHGFASYMGWGVRLTMRSLVCMAGLITAAGFVASCSRLPDIELDNRSGQEVLLRDPAGKTLRAPAGQITGPLPILSYRMLNAGSCTYHYGRIDVGFAQPRSEGGDPPALTYHVRLEPDFTLRLFNVVDGQVGGEVVSNGWPAQPTIECRSSG